MSTTPISVNGVLLDQVSALDRGLAYGDGLFETILVRNSVLVFELAHFERLHAGASLLNIPFSADLTHLTQSFLQQIGAPHKHTDGVLKLILTRGAGGRGYAPPEHSTPSLIMQWHAGLKLPSQHNLTGISLYECKHLLPCKVSCAGLKSLNRLDNVLARAEFSGTHHAEGLLSDFDGHVIEGTMTNLFWVKDNTLFTPSLADVGVHGIMRAQIMQRFDTVSIKAKLDSILAADELFLCNSVNGIWPVVAFNQKNWPVGPVTKRIQSEFLQFL